MCQKKCVNVERKRTSSLEFVKKSMNVERDRASSLEYVKQIINLEHERTSSQEYVEKCVYLTPKNLFQRICQKKQAAKDFENTTQYFGNWILGNN